MAVTVYDQTGTNYGYSYDLCDKFYHSEISEARGKYYTNQNAMDLSQIATFYGTTMNTGAWGNPKNVYYINNIKLRAIATEGGETPEPTPTFTHRLESVGTAWGNTAYTFDEENTNRVVAIDEDGIVTEVTYNEAGQIASAVATVEEVDEEGNPVETVISGVEYEYDENGVWTSFTETVQGWFGGTVVTETALNYDAEGRLVSLTSEELVRTIAYNEAGLISEVMEGYVVVEEGEEEEGEEAIRMGNASPDRQQGFRRLLEVVR